MAAFHPETLRLLRQALAATLAQHDRDQAKRVKFDVTSKSKMAAKLTERIGEAVGVMRDLNRLIAFAEGVNRLYTEHEQGAHDGHPRHACVNCPDIGSREPRSSAAAALLSKTPLAAVFGDADPEERAR